MQPTEDNVANDLAIKHCVVLELRRATITRCGPSRKQVEGKRRLEEGYSAALERITLAGRSNEAGGTNMPTHLGRSKRYDQTCR
jgi:hypothetical protein